MSTHVSGAGAALSALHVTVRTSIEAYGRRAGGPGSTYRLQFRPGFGFAEATDLVPFLSDLGITEVYASPILQARRGSEHGYDVTDPLTLNAELGAWSEFDALVSALKRRGMGLVLDIVPNHMAACAENPYWADVLEHGRASEYARWFDIDWDAAPDGKLTLPMLGKPYAEALRDGELRVGMDERGPCVRYYEHRLPLAPASRRAVLEGEPPERILAAQAYRLEYWRAGRHAINYRRFFDINELVGVRVEDPRVFAATHSLILRLVREGKVSGLRVDHIDGLRDPLAYLRRLAHAVPRRLKDFYIVVEKVLLGEETLPADWPVRGTTGYDFLHVANAAFVDAPGLERLERIYRGFTGVRDEYEDIVYTQKKRMLAELFPCEMQRLAKRLVAVSAPGLCEDECREAIREVTACLPVYRTYTRSFRLAPRDRATISTAIEAARVRNGSLSAPALDCLRRVLLLEIPRDLAPERRSEWLDFVLRWQQLSGPAMAKGMEDTAGYVYNPLVSLNVIGGSAGAVSAAEFHRFNGTRLRRWPSALNATSTHDTKRSEDVRARINVLSELPDLWADCLERWSRWNALHKRTVRGEPAPSANDEAMLYQVLLGAWPLHAGEVACFRERMKRFVIKAAREAKQHTNWIAPDADYEAALVEFTARIMQPGPFLIDFLRVQEHIAPFGAIGSLAQALLKIASPGVPDFYQGTLLWDFSLVDPDNRRPVDFRRRTEALDEIRSAESPELIESLVESWEDGRIKLYTIAKALGFRRARHELFRCGEYIPLAARGPAGDHVIAFARRLRGQWAIAAVPRFAAKLCGARNPFSAAGLWRGAFLQLPKGAPGRWTSVFTRKTFGGKLELSNLFRRFPVVLLSASEDRSPEGPTKSYESHLRIFSAELA
jgi:(1->4)-alpha-D-glucan 1-alpha-D-glucosylmutase